MSLRPCAFSDQALPVREGGLIVDKHAPVVLAFGRLRQEDCKFQVSLSYTVRLGLYSNYIER